MSHARVAGLLRKILLAVAILPAPYALAGEGPELAPPPMSKSAPAAVAPNLFSAEVQQIDFANGLLGRKLFQEALVEFDAFLKSYPASPRRAEATFLRGECLFSLGQYRQSDEAFLAYLKLEPKGDFRPRALLRLGCGRFELKQDAQAVQVLKELQQLTGDPKITQAGAYYLGRSLERSGNPDEARRAYEAALTAGGELKALSLFALAQMVSGAGQLAEAEALYRAFAEEYPDHRLAPEAGLRRAHHLHQSGKPQEAIAEYRRLLTLAKQGDLQGRAYLGLGWVYLSLNEYLLAEEAGVNGVTVASGELGRDLSYLQGLSLLRQKKYAPAITALAGVTGGVYQRAAILSQAWAHLGLGQLDLASKQAEAYLATPPLEEPGTAYYLLATISFRKAAYMAAVEMYQGVLTQAQSEYREESSFQLAICFQRMEKDESAEAAYGSFLVDFPKSPHRAMALLQRAAVLRRMKRLPEAILGYSALLAESGVEPPVREQALLEQALCHYELNQFKEMESCYRTILKDFSLSAAAPEALYWVAWVAQHEQKWAEASALYERFLSLYPKDKQADRVRYRLGMTWFQAGDEKKAAEVYYEILTVHPQIEINQEELLWLGRRFTRDQKLDRASVVYDVLLKRHPGPEIQSMALYYQAEVLRQQGKFTESVDYFNKLIAGGDPRFLSLAQLGLGMSLRQLKKMKEARAELMAVRFSPDDPMLATLQLELAMLDRAEGLTAEAIQRFMRVGLLYDDLDLAGEALFEAGITYESIKEREKALSCYRELTEGGEGSYAVKHSQSSPWSARAKERIKALEAATQAPSAVLPPDTKP